MLGTLHAANVSNRGWNAINVNQFHVAASRVSEISASTFVSRVFRKRNVETSLKAEAANHVAQLPVDKVCVIKQLVIAARATWCSAQCAMSSTITTITIPKSYKSERTNLISRPISLSIHSLSKRECDTFSLSRIRETIVAEE